MAARIVYLSDKLAWAFAGLVGTSVSGYGAGSAAGDISQDWGMSRGARELQEALVATLDYGLLSAVGASVQALASSLTYRELANQLYGRTIVNLSSYLGRGSGIAGVENLVGYLRYHNVGVGGNYESLVSPAFAALYACVPGQSVLGAENVAPLPIANLGQKNATGAVFTAGTPVDTNLYAGFKAPVVTLSGFAGSGGTLTVTGSGRLADGSLVSGLSFSATITGNGGAVLSPNTAGSVLAAISGIALPAGMSAGVAIVSGAAPTGRTLVTTPVDAAARAS